MLSDNDIQDVTTNAVRARKLSWLGFKKDKQGEYVIPVLSPSDFQFAREIESAATAPLLARIAELEKWQAEHWNAFEIINNYFVSKDLLLVVEDGGPDAAARNIVHSVVALERELEEARKDAERWAPISGYEDSYEVSSLGRVRSLNRVDAGGNKRAGRFMTPSAIRKGYLKVSLNKGNVAVETYVHRLVATAFVENPLNLPQVNHKDGDPANNAVSNLEWVTNAENQTHARRVLAKGVRAVYGISKENGSRVDFGTLAEAEEAGFKRANIQKCIAGVRSHHQGYAWFDAAIDAAIKEQT